MKKRIELWGTVRAGSWLRGPAAVQELVHSQDEQKQHGKLSSVYSSARLSEVRDVVAEH